MSLFPAALVLALAAPQAPPFLNINPSWSPDGRQLVFESRRHDGRRLLFTSEARGNWEIYAVTLDGSGLERLTTGADGLRGP